MTRRNMPTSIPLTNRVLSFNRQCQPHLFTAHHLFLPFSTMAQLGSAKVYWYRFAVNSLYTN